MYFTNRAKAKVLVSTTSNLDIYTMKKKKTVENYAYIFHAPTDVAFYEKHALDNYDTIICASEFQKRSIRHIEKKRNSVQKNLINGGLPYFDTFKKQDYAPSLSEKPVALFAPSWGPRNSLKKFGIGILSNLINHGFKIILRPHPQSYISEKEFMDKVVAFVEENENIQLDRNNNVSESIDKADFLISDYSGVIFDYKLFSSKPLVLLTHELDLGSYEADDLEEIWEFNVRKEIALEIFEPQINEIGQQIKKYLKEYNYNRPNDLGEKYFFNFNNASETIAKQIESIV